MRKRKSSECVVYIHMRTCIHTHTHTHTHLTGDTKPIPLLHCTQVDEILDARWQLLEERRSITRAERQKRHAAAQGQGGKRAVDLNSEE